MHGQVPEALTTIVGNKRALAFSVPFSRRDSNPDFQPAMSVGENWQIRTTRICSQTILPLPLTLKSSFEDILVIADIPAAKNERGSLQFIHGLAMRLAEWWDQGLYWT